MKLNEQIKFGMYKGYTLQEVIKYDPKYVQWCISDVSGFTVDQDIKDLVNVESAKKDAITAKNMVVGCNHLSFMGK